MFFSAHEMTEQIEIAYSNVYEKLLEHPAILGNGIFNMDAKQITRVRSLVLNRKVFGVFGFGTIMLCGHQHRNKEVEALPVLILIKGPSKVVDYVLVSLDDFHKLNLLNNKIESRPDGYYVYQGSDQQWIPLYTYLTGISGHLFNRADSHDYHFKVKDNHHPDQAYHGRAMSVK